MLRTLRRVERMRGKNAGDDAPDLTVLVQDEVLAVLGLDDAGHLPHAVVTRGLGVGLQLLVAMQRNRVHIPHDLFRMRKHIAIHPLKDELRFREGIAIHGQKRIVYVAAAERHQRNETSLDVEFIDEQRKFHGKSFVEGK